MTRSHPPLPTTFGEFWPWYMAAHQNSRCRRVHYLGSSGGLLLLGAAVLTGNLWLALGGLLIGYACAWFGHFVFERNRPATWVKPWWSFMGDWKMFWMWLTRREREAVALGADLPDIVDMMKPVRR